MVKDANNSPAASEPTARPDLQAMTWACTAAAGHFDELRGTAAPSERPPTPAWRQFFDRLPPPAEIELDRRWFDLQRRIRDCGVGYNVYADEGGPQRPWPPELFPLLIEADSWQQIEAGVLQRIRLLERVLADVYGPQQLLARGLLPPALVHGHPGYLRPLHGVQPVGGRHLHLAAFDLAHGPDGTWRIVNQHCQAPSGFGYLLENRRAISAQFEPALQTLPVQSLAASYRALMDGLMQMSPAGADSHLALLTPGPYNESYFEHACLARQLGLTLVEGRDLSVREQRLYLKTLKGLLPVHGLIKRVDDEYLDPLELRADSTLGVPGLLQAIRAGHVLVANAPGSAFLESSALMAFLPALSRHLLQEELTLPAQQLAAWAARIEKNPQDHALQIPVPLSQMPTWQPAAGGTRGRMVARPFMLRVFAVADGAQSWRVLPGGLAHVAGADADADGVSMQHEGSRADVWALTRGAVDAATLVQPPAALTPRTLLVTSRSAENLFWLGRYGERTENAIRLARLTLECLNGEDRPAPPLLTWLGQMAVKNTLVLPAVPAPAPARRDFERALIASLAGSDGATSVGFHLRALKMAAASVRERLSQPHWRAIVRAEEELVSRCTELARDADPSAPAALQMLKNCGEQMAAIAGMHTEHVTRDDGWLLLGIGRHIEQLGFLANSLLSGLQSASLHNADGLEAMAALFDSSVTVRPRYRQSRDLATLIDLLVLDRDNPHSLACVAGTLREQLAKLAGSPTPQPSALALKVPDPGSLTLAQLCEVQPDGSSNGCYFTLNDLLLQCSRAAHQLAEEIGAGYFSHTTETNRSMGTS